MNAGADRVLAERARRVEAPPNAGSLAVAALLHASALALVFLLPRLAPPPKPLEFVPVQVVPAAALGVRKPLPPAPAPEAAKSAPAEPEPLPEPEPKKTDAPVLPPEKPVKPKPEAPKPEPVKPAAKPTTAPAAPKAPAAPSKGPTAPNPRPAAPAAPQTTPGTEVGRRGSPTGTPLGSSSFGSEIAGLDNPDFTYGYYIDQLLAAIDSNWVRPPVGDRVRAIVSFRIQRNGGITDLRVAEPSGFNAFDLAALRAVQSAAPFPPLPRAYKNDSLGVNLIVR